MIQIAMDKFFQKLCFLFPAYKLNTKIKKKLFYIVFSLFKIFLNGPFIINFNNYKIFAYPQKRDCTRFLLTRLQVPDPRERNIIVKNLKNKNNIFIDCGANVGFYTLNIATKVKNIKVYAFEPSKKEILFLKKNLKLNNIQNTEVIEMAIGNENGTAIFNDARNINSNDTSNAEGFITKNFSNSFENYKVGIITIDKFFENKIIPKDCGIFIKVDLEGYDLKAIVGATNTLINYDCSLIFEFSKMIMQQKDYSLKCFDFFLKNNFKIFDIYGLEVKPENLERKIEELDKDHVTCGNFVLTKKKLDFSF